MAFLRQWSLMLFVLALGGGQLFAASHEERDFAAAAAAFHDGMWSRAEVQFAQFIEKYPDSAHVPEAGLMQAQADAKQGKLQEAVTVLQARESSAGSLADQYAYWIGQAQFQNADYSDAADTFARLSAAYPESSWQLDAVVNEAASLAKLDQWAQVETLLQTPGGVFQEEAKTNATDDRVLNGRLLLGRALLSQNNPGGAVAVLQSSEAFKHNPEFDWRRLSMLCEARLADGDTNGALALTTNLLEAATRAKRPDLGAQSIAEQASVLEQMGRLSDAIAIYSQNLTNAAPVDWQRQAVLKIAELSAAQTNFLDAENSLDDFLSRFPTSPEADSVALALGELHLKSYLAQPSSTNDDLVQAQAYLDQFISTFTNSPLLGKAYLDRGWSFWIQGRWPDSAADFQSAVEKLPPSVDQAVAHFKLGDAQFKQNDLPKARDNYEAVVNNFTNYPVVGKTLGAQALYQALRACMDLNDVSGMSNATARILKMYPVSSLAEKSILLDGEALSDLGQPSTARDLFQKFEQLSPNSPLLPDVQLKIAQTYELENDWPQAIQIYESWIGTYPTDTNNLPSVEYARAWAYFKAGNETNAFLLFTNFVAQYTNNGLAPVAQYWLGDYYYGQAQFQNAEKSYKVLFQTWPSSPLIYPAELMAGRAAMGRQDYNGATGYFVTLTGDTNCPPDWDKLALFAYGDAEMQMPSSDTNNALANFQQAITVFEIICKQYSDAPEAAHAWGEIGDCNLQLAALAQSSDQATNYYVQATNAYGMVMASPFAEIAARSQAQIGIGIVLEKLAALTNGVSQIPLLQAAQGNYLDVFFGNNLRDGETADPFWVKKAGLQALPLLETLNTGDPNKFIDQMEMSFPQMKDSLEKQRLELSRPKNQ